MRSLIVALVFFLVACASPPRPDTAQSKACTAKARAVAYTKERAVDGFNRGSTMGIMMVWLGNEEDAYNDCMKTGK